MIKHDLKRPRATKFKSKKTNVDGLKFDSKKEALRYKTLRDMQEYGIISELECQVPFVLAEGVKFQCEARKKPALRYVSDFTYKHDGKLVVEDVKSSHTRSLPAYRIKKHLMMTVHGIEINEI
ncbi:DUF1064 domain-containing protein [Acinetobacter rathckeae]|uniref:DUF1064 domain-containing protein n=1 Tax=Acinetobacter rathckeae TaxID=2605272 RepID=UPI0018A32C6A|nr:DUF1064 domain-containing protein [Acinetobacter rathckeae]MBF7687060.1 DUF1064 domain-containing protein [Acinetobacter rathckeae]